MSDAPILSPKGIMNWMMNETMTALLNPCACCRGMKTTKPYDTWGDLCNACALAIGEEIL